MPWRQGLYVFCSLPHLNTTKSTIHRRHSKIGHVIISQASNNVNIIIFGLTERRSWHSSVDSPWLVHDQFEPSFKPSLASSKAYSLILAGLHSYFFLQSLWLSARDGLHGQHNKPVTFCTRGKNSEVSLWQDWVILEDLGDNPSMPPNPWKFAGNLWIIPIWAFIPTYRYFHVYLSVSKYPF